MKFGLIAVIFNSVSPQGSRRTGKFVNTQVKITCRRRIRWIFLNKITNAPFRN